MVSTAIDPHAPVARWRPVIAARRDRLLPWALMITSAWLVGGGYLDGWAHSHGKVDQSFFTPGTPLLYAGYGLSLVGTLMFAAGGAQAHTAWRDVTQAGCVTETPPSGRKRGSTWPGLLIQNKLTTPSRARRLVGC